MPVYKIFDQGNIKTSEYPIDLVREVREPDDITYDNDNRLVRLHFGNSGDAKTISSVTQLGDYTVDVEFDRVKSIPHDYVVACLSRDPEGHQIDGMSPDIAILRPDGLDLFEVSTTRSTNLKTQQNDVINKTLKYKHLVTSGQANSLSVISVSLTNIVTTFQNHLAIDSVSSYIIGAYRLGRKIMNIIELNVGVDLPDSVEYNDCLATLSRELWPALHPEGREEQCFIDDDYDELIETTPLEHTYSIKTRSIPKTNEESWFKKDGRLDLGAVASVPMFSFTEEPQGVCDVLLDWGHRATSSLYLSRFSPPVVDLKAYRDLKDKVKSQDKSAKTILIRLNDQQRLDLAMRGVMAKELKMHPSIIEHRERHKEPLSNSQPTDDIHKYLTTPSRFVANEIHKIPSRVSEMIKTDALKYYPSRLVNMMLSCEFMQQLSMFQRIISEVILEMKMNPRDHQDKKMFIIKEVVEDLWVVIRPTRYSGKTNSHVFYQLTSLKPISVHNGIFESWYENGLGSYCTKFMSLTRERAAQYINIVEQVLSIWFLLLDELQSGITPNMSFSTVMSVAPTVKYMMLIMLEAKESTSRNLQQLRYYYMDVIATGGPKPENWKFMSKIDNQVRSRLLIYTMANLRQIHYSGSIHVKHNEEKEEDANFDETLLTSHLTKELEINIPTPALFTAKTMQQLLIMMYVCVLHNKDESEPTLAAKQIVSKIVKMELALKTAKYAKGDPSSHVNTDDYGPHDWSIRMVRHGASLLRDDLTKKSGDLHIIAAQCLSETTMLELATAKASHSGNDTSQIDDVNDLARRTSRSKCFIELMKISDRLPSNKLFRNVDSLLELHRETNREIHVKMFKKNQIGGTREIMILDFTSRCLVRILEDISRSLAQLCDLDMLTKPKQKHTLLRAHMKQTKLEKERYTKRYSLDKTTWCQRFTNPVFYTMLSTLLPKYRGFFKYILNSHTKKKIELPEMLMRSFLESSKSNYDNFDEVKSLWREFHGLDPDYLMGEHSPCIKNISNMMQGILHYTSTLLHCCYMYYIKSEAIKIIDLMNSRENISLHLTMDMQVSSDDSGIIATVSGVDSTSTRARKFFTTFEACMFSVEKGFCMQTSIEKSTMTTMSLYEFNSAFNSGNNLSSPLIKFVARSVDDNVADSLRARVDTLYSSLREVRANGGSGMLCTSISYLQHLALMNSFGLQILNDFDNLSGPIYDSKLSLLGAYMILPPCLSGLFGADFSDYWSAKDHDISRKVICAVRKNPNLIEDDQQVDRLVYKMWPTKRYMRCLDSLGIDRPKLLNSNFDEIKTLIEKPADMISTMSKLRFSLINYSMSRSFAITSRTDNQFAMAYILWDRIFKVGDQKLAIDEYYNLLISTDVTPTLDIFPLRHDYDYYISYSQKALIAKRTSKRYVLRHQGFASMHTDMPTSAELYNMILKDWYGENTKVFKSTRSKISALFPWYSSDRDTCLKNSGLLTPLQLLNFITSFTGSHWGFNIIASGSSRDFTNVVKGLLMLNTMREHVVIDVGEGMSPIHEPVPESVSQITKAFENRITDWCFLATVSKKENLSKLNEFVLEDIGENIRNNAEELKIETLNQSDEFMRHSLLSFVKRSHFYDALRNITKPQTMYREIQKHVGGKWTGIGVLLHHTKAGSALIRVNGSVVTSLSVTSLSVSVKDVIERHNFNLPEDLRKTVVPITQLISPPSGIRFYRGDGRANLQFIDSNGKPVLKIDTRSRLSDVTLDCCCDRPLIANWLLRNSSAEEWEMALREDSDLRPFFIDMLRNVVRGVKTFDQSQIGAKEVIVMPNKPLYDVVDNDDLLGDFLDQLVDDLTPADSPIDVLDNWFDLDFEVDQFMTSETTDPYFQADINRLLFHPFIRFYTIDSGQTLPSSMSIIRYMLRFENSHTIKVSEWESMFKLGYLDQNNLQIIDNPDFLRACLNQKIIMTETISTPRVKRSRVKTYFDD